MNVIGTLRKIKRAGITEKENPERSKQIRHVRFAGQPTYGTQAHTAMSIYWSTTEARDRKRNRHAHK